VPRADTSGERAGGETILDMVVEEAENVEDDREPRNGDRLPR
jgi:hypothetical protein